MEGPRGLKNKRWGQNKGKVGDLGTFQKIESTGEGGQIKCDRVVEINQNWLI